MSAGRSVSSRAFEALGRVTWKLARRKASDEVRKRTPGRTTREEPGTERR